jgi:sRNA-binding carbon storage regulator CsrA
MLVLTRRSGERVHISPALEVRVLAVQPSRVKLALADRRSPQVPPESARQRGYYVFRKGEGRSLVVDRRAGQKVRVDPAVELAMLAIRDGNVTLGVDGGSDAF